MVENSGRYLTLVENRMDFCVIRTFNLDFVDSNLKRVLTIVISVTAVRRCMKRLIVDL